MSQKLRNAKVNEEKETVIKAIKTVQLCNGGHINLYGKYDFTKI